jgi:hypothetical protein
MAGRRGRRAVPDDLREPDVVAADADRDELGVGGEAVELRRFGPGLTSWGMVMSSVSAPLQLGSRKLLTPNAAATRWG